MKALRIQVERVVRPIRATYLRKDRMREELLAHLTRLYEQELLRTGDVVLATVEAIRRFGDAAALTRELQTSVPRLEQLGCVSFPMSGPIKRRAGESPLRYIVRTNVWAGTFSTLAFFVFIALVAIVANSQRPHRADQLTSAQMLVFLCGCLMFQFATMLGKGLLCEAIRRQWERRSAAATAGERRKANWRIAVYTAASSIVLSASVAALMLLINRLSPTPFITSSQFWCITIGAAALDVPLMLLQAWSWKATTRRFENWDSLDLDEQPAA